MPLSDVRIIAIEQYGAGPFGSVHLADLGAEVIKIEDPSTGGDIGRYVVPEQHGEDSLFFETFNRNKRSLGLDISTPEGRAVFEDLVRVSDVVHSNLRGDVPAKLRIRYDDLKHLNPAIVCSSLSGFGMTGPRSGVIGVKKELAIERFLTLTQVRFETATEDPWLNAVLVEGNSDGRATSIRQLLVPAGE